MVKTIRIAGRKVGEGEPCFIIAEAGVNHNGSLERAMRLIDVAADAGADAVKFQTFKAENVISPTAPKAAYQAEATGAKESQLEMVKKLELPFEAFDRLAEYSAARGILFLSTPFDDESLDYLNRLGVPAHKIPSGEITNLPFLDRVGRSGRPVILSTGMSTLGEVGTAVETIYMAGGEEIILLHCVSNYPADPADVNLRAMETMRSTFGRPIGYSDHTPGIEIAMAAVTLGACVIEKHFTLDKSLPGPDHAASLDPEELRQLVRGIRAVESAMGDGVKRPVPRELDTLAVARKSLVAARDIPAGVVLAEEMIAIKRPGTGLPPAQRAELVGRTTKRAIVAGELFTPEMIA